MSLNSILKQRLTEQFTNAQLVGASPISPRKGCYFIKNVDYKELIRNGQRFKTPIATALWKANDEDSFNKDVCFHVALSSLGIGDPLDYMNLVNKTIRIYNAELVKDTDATAMRISCDFEILTQRPTFTTILSHILSSFNGDASTLTEAYRKMENGLCIDYSDPILSQASNDAYDAPQDNESID